MMQVTLQKQKRIINNKHFRFMQLKEYLIETFKFNDDANKKLLGKINLLGDKKESIKLFSHLINTQCKWMAKISKDPGYDKMSWWEPVYDFEQLGKEWDKSTGLWINYIAAKPDEELSTETVFIDFDHAVWAAILKDIALQLNYHSIHHRAQIQVIIRQQGIEPDFLDYIGTKVRKVG
jgi:uncharacterized damage-inducible protein DinB